ncbi:MAG TPA: hypothetical protein VMY78_16695 [Solirubrobacteraceae bacterium]|nr:hypothetical protein [Solirubrobacteraceae bacterium]
MKHTRKFASLVAAGSLLAVPAIGQAAKSDTHGKSGTHSESTKSCTKAHARGFSLSGTLVSVVADDAATTDVNEGAIKLLITSGNAAAKRSGDIADQDADRKGVQIKGAEYTIAGADTFSLRLRGYEGTDTPSVGDRVKVNGRIAIAAKKCVPAGTSLADRLGAVDIRKVTISDRDPDA